VVDQSLRQGVRVVCVLLAVLGASTATTVRAATIAVAAGGDLQAAINTAQPGDVITLAPGATYQGNFRLPNKGALSQAITIRSAASDSLLPPSRVRITPAYAQYLPTIKSPNNMSALITAPGSNHWTLMFLEFQANVGGDGDVIALGAGDATQTDRSQVPYALTLDRVYVHGDPVFGQKRGIALNSRDTAIVNSYVSDCKAVGQEAQAIGGFNGPGNFLIENNYLEGSTQSVLLGGSDPLIPNLVTTNVTVRRNHLTKPLAWQHSGWLVKNLFELKNAQDVLVEGNLLENLWVAGQSGYPVLFTPRNQNGTAPWAVVQRVVFQHNLVRHTAGGVNILGADDTNPSQRTNNITVRDNVFDDLTASTWGAGARPFLIGNGPDSITIDHNTIVTTDSAIVYLYGGTDTAPTPITNVRYTNNMSAHQDYGIDGTNHSPGLSTIQAFLPLATVKANVLAGGSASDYPPGNLFPTVGDWQANFVNFAAGNYHLLAGSPYKGAGTDGADLGANLDRINAEVAVALSGNNAGTNVPLAPSGLRIIG
jgi:hypothetical protein